MHIEIPWHNVSQIIVSRNILSKASVSYVCALGVNYARCGACGRGLIKAARTGDSCPKCPAVISEIIPAVR